MVIRCVYQQILAVINAAVTSYRSHPFVWAIDSRREWRYLRRSVVIWPAGLQPR